MFIQEKIFIYVKHKFQDVISYQISKFAPFYNTFRSIFDNVIHDNGINSLSDYNRIFMLLFLF